MDDQDKGARGSMNLHTDEEVGDMWWSQVILNKENDKEQGE